MEEQQLLFLTSNSAIVPTGRNARKKARSEWARESVAQGPVRGTFSTISVVSRSHNATSTPPRKTDERPPPRSSHNARHSTKPSISLGQASTGRHQPLYATSLQIVCFQDLLTEATARIRALLAKVCEVEPSFYREALRCRPWTRADFATGMLPSTPELSSAVVYLGHRLSGPGESGSLDVVGLKKYSSALMQLREALRDSDKRVRSSTLAASHILALCAMFDFGQNLEWTKLVEGVVVVIKFQSERGDPGYRRHFWSHAGPVMMQAFLTRQRQAVLDQPWRHILETAGQERFIPPEDAQNFADSAELALADLPHRPVCSQLASSHERRQSPLEKAHDIRSRIRGTLVRDLASPAPMTSACSLREVLDERLAVMFGLDDFISRLGSSVHDMRRLTTDSQMLYQQVMATDLVVGPIQEDEIVRDVPK